MGVRGRGVVLVVGLTVAGVLVVAAWLLVARQDAPAGPNSGVPSGPPLTGVIGGVPGDQVPGIANCSAIEQTTVTAPQGGSTPATPLPTPHSLDVRGGVAGSGESSVNPFAGGCAPASPRPTVPPPALAP